MPGLRVDVISITPQGEIWIVECKSCRADFVGDRKWQGYLDFCDRFFWATDCDFPVELLPEGRPATLVRTQVGRLRRLVEDLLEERIADAS